MNKGRNALGEVHLELTFYYIYLFRESHMSVFK